MKMHLRIERSAKAVDERHRAEAARRSRPRTACAQRLLHRTEEAMQRQGFDSRIVLDEVAHALRHRQHP